MNGSQKAVDSAVDIGTQGRTGGMSELPLPLLSQDDGNAPVFISEGAGFIPEGDLVDFDFARDDEMDED